MAVGETAKKLKQKESNISMVETAWVALHVLGKVSVLSETKQLSLNATAKVIPATSYHIFKHKCQRFSRMNDVVECHNIRVLQFL